MYQALYRKWRPKRFEDVVGQQHVTETLRRQVETGRLSHAYLFVGTRGTGKTTCAKILAKAANCEHPVNGDPCNECPSCRGIDSGAILDVEEMDAASNNSVDNIRALRDEAVFTPASVRKRVYIVDEVHMLSASAFNALLKILEEPPAHLIFILATTELRKVPATILSRCQRFSFRRISPEDVKARLMYVAEQEGIDLRPEAADMLSRLADGSMRDALSLLDQCAMGETVDEERVLSAIGLAGSGETAKMLDAVLAGDTSEALEILDRLYFSGKDAGSVLNELGLLMRDILIKKVAPKSAAKLISGAFSAAYLDKFVSSVSANILLEGVRTIQAATADVAQSTDKKTAAELCLIKLCLPETSAPVQSAPAVECPAPIAAPSAPAVQPAVSVPSAPKPADRAPWDDDEPFMKAPPVAAPAPQPASVPVQPANSDIWTAVLKSIEEKVGPASYSFLSDKFHAVGIYNDGVLEIRAKSDFAASMIDVPEVTNAVRDAATTEAGKPVRVMVTVGTVDTPLQNDKLDELARFGNVKFI